MSHMNDLLTKWSHQTVTILHATTAWDGNGMPVTSTGISYTVLVQYTNRAVINSQGKSVVSNCQILFNAQSTVRIDDVITLSDGTMPIIQSIEQQVDFDGNLEYVKVYT